MDVYLLEKENCSTYAVLAKNGDKAMRCFETLIWLKGKPREESAARVKGYKTRRLKDNQDGKTLSAHPNPVKISYPLGCKKKYAINYILPTELV